MSDEREYDCVDCGRHVIAFGYLGATEAARRCNSCQWIRDSVAPAHHEAVRERLGVPLAASRFVCLRCGAISHHPRDALEGYCVRCHDWTAPPPPGDRLMTHLDRIAELEAEIADHLPEIEETWI